MCFCARRCQFFVCLEHCPTQRGRRAQFFYILRAVSYQTLQRKLANGIVPELDVQSNASTISVGSSPTGEIAVGNYCWRIHCICYASVLEAMRLSSYCLLPPPSEGRREDHVVRWVLPLPMGHPCWVCPWCRRATQPFKSCCFGGKACGWTAPLPG